MGSDELSVFEMNWIPVVPALWDPSLNGFSDLARWEELSFISNDVSTIDSVVYPVGRDDIVSHLMYAFVRSRYKFEFPARVKSTLLGGVDGDSKPKWWLVCESSSVLITCYVFLRLFHVQ